MKADLDQLMADRHLDAFLVLGDSAGNPILQYLTGNIHLERAIVLKKAADPAMTLIHGAMERDNAQRSQLRLVDRDAVYNPYDLLRKHAGNALDAQCDYLQRVIADFALQGRVGVYGQADAGAAFVLLNALSARVEGTEIIGEYGDTLFLEARETKDADELADMAELGRRTCQVVDDVKSFLQGHAVQDETVMRADGVPLTIGHVRRFIRERLNRQNLFEDHATIFAQGKEAAVPHNAGSDERILRLGQTIIFDIFPRGESGYFHDMTRTWSLGYATEAVWRAWEQTKELFDRALAGFQAGKLCADFQALACDYYESAGHKTTRSHPGTHEGYVHSLGHGIGLDVHEGPNLSLSAGDHARLRPGHVVTVEPGLYYPDQGFGVRIEDAVALDACGERVQLTQYPYDLVVPMPRGA